MKTSTKISISIKQSLSAHIEKIKSEFLTLIDADFYYQQDAHYHPVKLKSIRAKH